MTSKLTEHQVQALLMQYVLYARQHIIAVPNTKVIYWPTPWECDLASVTRARFVHEFEIKRSMADYRADFICKRSKHHMFLHPGGGWKRRPNYFWFVTCDFDIEPPEYAGWIRFLDTGNIPGMRFKKEAPRLHQHKIPDKKLIDIGRILFHRLENIYSIKYLRPA
ncbi:hypothetical protein LCGC14_0761840 [marine sediment metagenome]|uniref:Uncharacterized protein n=1 Tax=marine sediment metagenome TaxID=412755 RepID=A0A0F9Q504_9ZZZZ